MKCPQEPGETPSMRIGDLARELDLTPRTLRYWEERRLLPAAQRTPGRFRTYGSEHLRAARGICQLKRAGFSLDEIGEIQGRLGGSTTALAGLAGLSAALEYRERRIRESLAERGMVARRGVEHSIPLDIFHTERPSDDLLALYRRRAPFTCVWGSVAKTREGSLEIQGGSQNVKGSIQIYSAAPNRRHVLVQLGPQQKIEAGTDGFTHWTLRTPGGVKIEEGDERADEQHSTADPDPSDQTVNHDLKDGCPVFFCPGHDHV